VPLSDLNRSDVNTDPSYSLSGDYGKFVIAPRSAVLLNAPAAIDPFQAGGPFNLYKGNSSG